VGDVLRGIGGLMRLMTVMTSECVWNSDRCYWVRLLAFMVGLDDVTKDWL
jgi:hypothetical protein